MATVKGFYSFDTNENKTKQKKKKEKAHDRYAIIRINIKKIKSYPRATDTDNNLNLYQGGESTEKKTEFLISFPKL